MLLYGTHIGTTVVPAHSSIRLATHLRRIVNALSLPSPHFFPFHDRNVFDGGWWTLGVVTWPLRVMLQQTLPTGSIV